MVWLNHWGIDENDILLNILMSKILLLHLKEKLWCEENLAGKRKLRDYKEAINANLEAQKYLSIGTRSRRKIDITKIRTNSHELHSETGH